MGVRYQFSVNDIKKIIKNISSTSAGFSGITSLLLKKTVEVMAPVIWRWCRIVLDTEHLPAINILSLISLLLKPGKDPGDPGSYQPVALTELLMRVLEKVLQQVMQRHA